MSDVEVRVPDIGDFDSVDVIDVHVKPGDSLAAEDPLITLETDKASMDVPAPRAGKVVSVALKVGAKVKAGDLILTLAPSDAGVPRKRRERRKRRAAQARARERRGELTGPQQRRRPRARNRPAVRACRCAAASRERAEPC